MKLSTVKRYKRKHRILGSLLLKNPVLVLGLDLPFVIATTTSLKNAAALTIQLLIIHMTTVSAGMITRRRLPMWQRAMVNMGVSTVMMMLAQELVLRILPGVSNSLGMYLYLMAVNGMTLLQSGSHDKRAKPKTILTSAFFNTLGFGLVAAIVSLIREWAGNGTLWGIAVPTALKVPGLMLPFGGFLVVSFILAASKYLNKRFMFLAVREEARKEARYTRIRVISEEIM